MTYSLCKRMLDNNNVVFDYSVCVYGGSDRRAQIDAVKSGVEIVIGKSSRCFS